MTRILDFSLTSSRRRPSVSAVTACFVALYMALHSLGITWPAVLWVQNASTYIEYLYHLTTKRTALNVTTLAKVVERRLSELIGPGIVRIIDISDN